MYGFVVEMAHNCIRCGAEGSVKELDRATLPLTDFANIDLDLDPEMTSHIYNIHYKMNPWWCQECKSVYFRGSQGKMRKETGKTCRLCGIGSLSEYENLDIGEVVIKDTREKVGDFTIDEAIVCNSCGYMSVMETGIKTE